MDHPVGSCVGLGRLEGMRPDQLKVHATRRRNARPAPSAYGLRLDAAEPSDCAGAAEFVDHPSVRMAVHPNSVNRLSAILQAGFRIDAYALQMALQRELLTAQDRIAWAIERAKANGTPPEALANRSGVSRPGMLHWTKETTKIEDVGIGPLMKFAQAAGVNLEWLMTGKGDPFNTYTPSAEVEELTHALELLSREEPAEYKVLARMIRRASSDVQDQSDNDGNR